MVAKRSSRSQDILQALARMLENSRGSRITTAALAAELGVSEAALYRHFPSKTRMYEGLIEFIEETIFARVTTITKDEPDAVSQCYRIISLCLTFAEKNAGISRLLHGDALTGETERLHHRIAQFFSRLESQLKQILREAEISRGLRVNPSVSVATNIMIVILEGKISQFVRSDFKQPPTQHWSEQWALLENQLFNQ
jgi:TetR/AcrR family transcriptional regulator